MRRLPGGAADIEASVLLGFVLDKPQSYLYAWPERTLEAEALDIYTALVRRRASGEPLAYITGRREFWSLDLDVNPATLIPRPETELLVERALRHIPATPGVEGRRPGHRQRCRRPRHRQRTTALPGDRHGRLLGRAPSIAAEHLPARPVKC